MKFAENIKIVRTVRGLTQEELAEKLDVSRQAVSKWEAGVAHPEMEKILQICDMFDMDMNVLLRGNVEESFREDNVGYDNFFTRFSRGIGLGVFVVILGVAVELAISEIMNTKIGIVVLLLFVAPSVFLFVWFGMQYSEFVKDHRIVTDFYTEKLKSQMKKKYIFGIASGVTIILFGTIGFFISESIGFLKAFSTSIMMLFVAFGAGTIVYSSIQLGKYNIEEYNKNAEKDLEESEYDDSVGHRIGVSIVLLAVGVFLALGFVWDKWHPGWVVFPIAGLLYAIACMLFAKKK